LTVNQSGSGLTGTYVDRDGVGSMTGNVAAGNSVRFTVVQPPFVPFTAQGTANADVTVVSGTMVAGFFGTPTFRTSR
jgi:hypothetical protein